MTDFISEDDLMVFERWLEYQGVDPATITEVDPERGTAGAAF